MSRDCSAAIFRQPAILRNLIYPLTKRLTSRVDAIYLERTFQMSDYSMT
jgi:hypothetical protein